MAYKARRFIDAIPGTGGIISAIARNVGCKWHTAKAAIERYPSVRKAYDDECEDVTDVAESMLIRAIRRGDVGAAKWWLTRKGKDRGFVESHAVDVTTGGEKVAAAVVYLPAIDELETESGATGEVSS